MGRNDRALSWDSLLNQIVNKFEDYNFVGLQCAKMRK
jgi:hypothetical protein